MEINFLAVFVAALVPMVMGFIWYNPKVLGNAWMKAAGITEDKMKGANMPVNFIVSFVLSFFLAFFLQSMVIHQFHIASVFFDYQEQIKDSSTPEGSIYKQVMDLVGMGHRTFGHGAFHGALSCLFVITPIMATNALFERKGFKYIAINCGYWIITLMIMGGIVSCWM
ncbi:MAG: DUF1761 domain-containing protein [Burkholderiales bacterium]|nr:DUF1761 domain-containing protein [Bacteroidia bacterium]